jgi:hypothetical protein
VVFGVYNLLKLHLFPAWPGDPGRILDDRHHRRPDDRLPLDHHDDDQVNLGKLLKKAASKVVIAAELVVAYPRCGDGSVQEEKAVSRIYSP